MTTPGANLDDWIRERLFAAVPVGIAIIDTSYKVVYANPAFERMFGGWKGRKCFDVYKDRDTICPHCQGGATFKDGRPRVSEESGFARDGRVARYIKHTFPIIDEAGNIPYLVEMSTDTTDWEWLRREHQALFDQVPCNVSLIDRDLRIVRANRRIIQKFGQVEGRPCYEVFKGLDAKCDECPAQRTFADGQVHTGHSIVYSPQGHRVHFQVTTAPLSLDGDETELVVEMAVDVTKTLKLEDDLRIAHAFLEKLIATSKDGIIATDSAGSVTVFNPAAREILAVNDGHHVTSSEFASMLPAGFLDQVRAGPAHVWLPDTMVTNAAGEPIPVRLVGVRLDDGDRVLGLAVSIQDLRARKQLEKEKLDAERLAAVGQTVAGLAHGVKNLITGLEGGMYMLNTGLKKGNTQRIKQGWEMLDRNIARISTFVRDFLSFSKGRRITVALADAPSIAQEVVELYAPRAEELGVHLTHETRGAIEHAPMDREGLHECLTNLVGNAIDACQMSDGQGSHVSVRTYEHEGNLVFEVEDDGCGMDYEVKRKVFTTFFTTKGLGGTGLGLLTTRKIVQEHGGRIELESEPGRGTTFRIVLPRDRLPEIDPRFVEPDGSAAAS